MNITQCDVFSSHECTSVCVCVCQTKQLFINKSITCGKLRFNPDIFHALTNIILMKPASCFFQKTIFVVSLPTNYLLKHKEKEPHIETLETLMVVF